MALQRFVRAAVVTALVLFSSAPEMLSANPAAKQAFKKAGRAALVKPRPKPPVPRPAPPTMAITKFKARNTALTPTIKYPPNDGFASEPKQDMTKVGDKMSRYGSRNGTFLAPQGTPFEQRALPAKAGLSIPEDYVVKKPFPVKSGAAAPAFGFPGGGTQFKADQSVQSLIDSGHLEPK